MLPPASAVFALIVCLALSCQFLFQRSLYQQWPWRAIAAAWASGLGEMAGIAATILLTLALAGRVPIRRNAARIAWLAMALLAGSWLGEWLSLWWHWGAWPTAGAAAILPRALRWVPIGALGAVALVARRRTNHLAEQLHQSEVEQLQIEQQQVVLQLQVLQSRVEPHFLFNTLATIRRLQVTNPQRGRDTLAGFIHYLRASLPGMREREVPLGRELDLTRAYLEVLRVRMGDRLKIHVDVDARFLLYRVPPLSVATLVENSIKHGIGNLPEGGTVAITARLRGDTLQVQVADDGKGFSESAGSGTGLANLRMWLRSLYGDSGRLVLSPNSPRGFVAMLQVPATSAPEPG